MADISSSSTTASVRHGPVSRLFIRNDANSDGKLSFQEFNVGQKLPGESDLVAELRREDTFDQIDADGDGLLTRTEVKIYRDEQLRQARSAILTLQELFGESSVPPVPAAQRMPVSNAAQSVPIDTTAGAAEGVRSPLVGNYASSAFAIRTAAMMDTDRDGQFSDAEINAYFERVVKDMTAGSVQASFINNKVSTPASTSAP